MIYSKYSHYFRGHVKVVCWSLLKPEFVWGNKRPSRVHQACTYQIDKVLVLNNLSITYSLRWLGIHLPRIAHSLLIQSNRSSLLVRGSSQKRLDTSYSSVWHGKLHIVLAGYLLIWKWYIYILSFSYPWWFWYSKDQHACVRGGWKKFAVLTFPDWEIL